MGRSVRFSYLTDLLLCEGLSRFLICRSHLYPFEQMDWILIFYIHPRCIIQRQVASVFLFEETLKEQMHPGLPVP